MELLESFLSQESLLTLNDLRGHKWRFVTGDPLEGKAGRLFAWRDVFVGMEGTNNVGIHLVSAISAVEGDENDYGRLEIDSRDSGLDDAVKRGEVSLKFGGSEVANIYVIRETIRHSAMKTMDWEIDTHYGVVFELSVGVVAIIKAGQQADALNVVLADSLENLEIPKCEDAWNFDLELGESIEIERRNIPLADLIRP
jgi:hypothetical protein